MLLHTVIRLPTLYSSSLHGQYLTPSKAFVFVSRVPTRETNSCSWGCLSVGLTSPLTKEYHLGLSPWTNR